ncbi:MAG TPA: hypothetical protein VM580_32790 [Labilithrix sp.]|nr:hypothetical protein [Labilithrix sp.]
MGGQRGFRDLAERYRKKVGQTAPNGDISSMQHEELDWDGGHRRDTGLPAGAHDRRATLRGEVVFASQEEQSQRCTELLSTGALIVTVPPPPADVRGRLGEVLEELVERELARMGAPSPYLAAWSAMPEDAQARLADQLFRARTVGATGIALALGSVVAIATPALDMDDSATLRWLAEASETAALVLLVDDADLMLLGHAAPLPLGILLATRRPSWDEPDSSAPTTDDATMNDTRVASLNDGEAIKAEAPVTAREPADAAVKTERAENSTPDAIDHATHAPPAKLDADPPSEPAAPKSPREKKASRSATAGVPVSGPKDGWRTWAISLSSARGAQPLAALERLFAESYVPLANAISAGLDEPRALRAYDDFRRSFERSYTDAFSAFGATNRRPRLVMDAYDIASKQARLSNARSSHILLVDSMRFDLGCLVRDALAREATGVAMLMSEQLLWSALPTTTMRQIETFARGLDALRDPAPEEPSESLRGRAAEVVRRLRVGSRELYKLDLVPAMLERAPDVLSSLPRIAEATAEAIARHISTLPPRTLLFIVGDHGFGVDRRGEVVTGGASPEEVLVPAFAWLLGELH